MPTNLDAVLVDTDIIVATPPRYLVAGIGEALVKGFEVDRCAAVDASNVYKATPTRLAPGIADACYAIIRAQGGAARRCGDGGSPTRWRMRSKPPACRADSHSVRAMALRACLADSGE